MRCAVGGAEGETEGRAEGEADNVNPHKRLGIDADVMEETVSSEWEQCDQCEESEQRQQRERVLMRKGKRNEHVC